MLCAVLIFVVHAMQALETVDELGSEHKEAKLQLKAQLCYRLGDYETAIKLYNELFSQQKVNFE